MSGVYRRHRERAGSGWGPWIVAGGILAVIGVAVLVVLLVRSKGGQLPGDLVVTPNGAVVASGEMTERELSQLLQAKGVKVEYGGNGILFRPDLVTAEYAKVTACVFFRKHNSTESARQSAGATREGTHWGLWTFTPHILEANGEGTLMIDIKKALGITDGLQRDERKRKETEDYYAAVQKQLDGKTVVKVIAVAGRMVNFVVQ